MADNMPMERQNTRAALPIVGTAEITESLKQHGMRWEHGQLVPVSGWKIDTRMMSLTVRRSMRSAAPREVNSLLSGLWLITSHERRTEEDYRTILRIYTAKLTGYPADLVQDVLTGWVDGPDGEWFPKLKQITRLLDEKLSDRSRLALALDEWGTPAALEKRINHLRWAVERIQQRQPLPQHKALVAKGADKAIETLLAEIAELEGMEAADV